MGLSFEWDPAKEASNQRKHHVSFEEARSVFSDPVSVIAFDPIHSSDEDRFVIVGMSSRKRMIVVCFTDRNERIRVLSAPCKSKRA